MSRLRRVADVEHRRREQAGAELYEARQELTRHHEQLQQLSTPTPEGEPTSGASMLAHRQAAGRMVERLVEAAQAQREVVSQAEQEFADRDKRARQIARAVELDDARLASARRRAEDRRMEDTMIAVAADRKKAPGSDSRRSGR